MKEVHVLIFEMVWKTKIICWYWNVVSVLAQKDVYPEFPGAHLCHSISPVPPFVSYHPCCISCVLMHAEQMLLSSWPMAIFQEGCDGSCSPVNFLMSPLLHRLQNSVQTPSLCIRNRTMQQTPFVLYENGFFFRDNKRAWALLSFWAPIVLGAEYAAIGL